MGADYFQFQVSRIWYRIFWGLMVTFNLLVVVIFALGTFDKDLQPMSTSLGMSEATVILAGANLLYLLAVHWLVAKKSAPLATLIALLLFIFVIFNGLDQTHGSQWSYAYVAGWLLASFMVGPYGLPLMTVFMTITVLYATLSSSFEPAKLQQPIIVMLSGSAVVMLLSFFFWRKRYIDMESQKVNQLSGMLKNNRQQSETLIQSIGDGIVVTNTEGKITLINPAASSLTGWPVEEALSLDVNSVVILKKEDGGEILEADNPFLQVSREQKKLSQAFQIVSRDNKPLTVSLTVSPVSDPETQEDVGVVAVIRDISDERAAEKQRADFISTASHEMRTPVAAIEGYLALALNDKVSSIDDRARGFLEKAHSSTQHLGKLFQDLLTSSKAEDGRLNNHPTVVEMGSFTQQLTDDLKFSAEKHGLIAEFIVGSASDDIDASKDASNQHLLKPLYYTHVDPDRIREVITNLFDNACKYTDTGKISIGLTGDTNVVQLYVKDTGAGIPAEDIPHLFQKFYRVDSSATRTIGGTGLGLFICRKIIEIYNGRIWVESTVGKGSTFFINLPRLTTQQANDLMAAESAHKS